MVGCFPDELMARYGHLPMEQWREVEAHYRLKEQEELQRQNNREMGDVLDDGERPTFGKKDDG